MLIPEIKLVTPMKQKKSEIMSSCWPDCVPDKGDTCTPTCWPYCNPDCSPQRDETCSPSCWPYCNPDCKPNDWDR